MMSVNRQNELKEKYFRMLSSEIQNQIGSISIISDNERENERWIKEINELYEKGKNGELTDFKEKMEKLLEHFLSKASRYYTPESVASTLFKNLREELAKKYHEDLSEELKKAIPNGLHSHIINGGKRENKQWIKGINELYELGKDGELTDFKEKMEKLLEHFLSKASRYYTPESVASTLFKNLREELAKKYHEDLSEELKKAIPNGLHSEIINGGKRENNQWIKEINELYERGKDGELTDFKEKMEKLLEHFLSKASRYYSPESVASTLFKNLRKVGPKVEPKTKSFANDHEEIDNNNTNSTATNTGGAEQNIKVNFKDYPEIMNIFTKLQLGIRSHNLFSEIEAKEIHDVITGNYSYSAISKIMNKYESYWLKLPENVGQKIKALMYIEKLVPDIRNVLRGENIKIGFNERGESITKASFSSSLFATRELYADTSDYLVSYANEAYNKGDYDSLSDYLSQLGIDAHNVSKIIATLKKNREDRSRLSEVQPQQMQTQQPKIEIIEPRQNPTEIPIEKGELQKLRKQLEELESQLLSIRNREQSLTEQVRPKNINMKTYNDKNASEELEKSKNKIRNLEEEVKRLQKEIEKITGDTQVLTNVQPQIKHNAMNPPPPPPLTVHFVKKPSDQSEKNKEEKQSFPSQLFDEIRKGKKLRKVEEKKKSDDIRGGGFMELLQDRMKRMKPGDGDIELKIQKAKKDNSTKEPLKPVPPKIKTIEELHNDLSNLEKQISKATEDLKKKKGDLSELENELIKAKEHNREMSQKKDECETCRKRNPNDEKNKDKLNAAIKLSESANEKVKKLESDRRKIMEEITSLEKKLMWKHTKLDETKEKIKKMEEPQHSNDL